MRIKERIEVVAKKLSPKDIAEFYKLEQEAYEWLKDNWTGFILTWYKYPDLRLGQFLFNQGLTDDKFYHTEEDELFKARLTNPADYTFWGTYGKNGKKDLEAWSKSYRKFGLSKSDIRKARVYFELPPIEKTKLKKKDLMIVSSYLQWIKLQPEATMLTVSEMDTDHIETVLAQYPRLKPELAEVMRQELINREGN